VIESYSLFSEYYKYNDYKTALPFGWQVLNCDAQKYAKWIYYKMEDCLWWMHDSSDLSIEEKDKLAGTTPYFYELAFQNFPDGRTFFQPHKAYVYETWLKKPVNESIKEYEIAIELDPEIDEFYYSRLGQLYITGASDSNDYKEKAIDLYTILAEKYPDNLTWNEILETLVKNIDQLVDIAKKSWEVNPDDESKAWKYAALNIKARHYENAIPVLESLVSKSPESVIYLAQLATAYQKTNNLTKAENTFKNLIKLEPNKKEHYLNLGIVYKDKGQFSQSRFQYLKASEVGNGWALPIYYEGNLYEQSAHNCDFDFDSKLVFQLAVDTYRKARNMDSSLKLAKDRINALSTVLPTKEDYLLRGYKTGDVIPIIDKCAAWVGKSIVVP
jgi:tetratricopeptide (TPR) repeat protein